MRASLVLAHLAVIAPLALCASFAQATTFSLAAVTSTDATQSYTFNFTDFRASGFEFSQLNGSWTGKLTSVSIDATLTNSVELTYANDLTIYVDPLPLSTGGALQVGGFSDTGASERHPWANGNSDEPGTTVKDTITLVTPISFVGTGTDDGIWLGNGYSDSTASGTWTGQVVLTFTSAVPEPSTWAMLGLGIAGLAAWSRRRREQALDA